MNSGVARAVELVGHRCACAKASFRICTVLSIPMFLERRQGLLGIEAAGLSLVFCKDIIDTCSLCIARSFEC